MLTEPIPLKRCWKPNMTLEYVQAIVFPPLIWYPRSLHFLSNFVHYDIGSSSIQRIISKLNLWTYWSILNNTRKHTSYLGKYQKSQGEMVLRLCLDISEQFHPVPTAQLILFCILLPSIQNKGSIIQMLPRILLFSKSKGTKVNRLSLSVQRVAFKYPSRLVWFFSISTYSTAVGDSITLWALG